LSTNLPFKSSIDFTYRVDLRVNGDGDEAVVTLDFSVAFGLLSFDNDVEIAGFRFKQLSIIKRTERLVRHRISKKML